MDSTPKPPSAPAARSIAKGYPAAGAEAEIVTDEEMAHAEARTRIIVDEGHARAGAGEASVEAAVTWQRSTPAAESSSSFSRSEGEAGRASAGEVFARVRLEGEHHRRQSRAHGPCR